MAQEFVKTVEIELTPKIQDAGRKSTALIRIGFLCITIFFMSAAHALAEQTISKDKKLEIVFEVANSYLLTMRKWEPNSYEIRLKGQRDDNIYMMSGFKLEDVERYKTLQKYSNGKLAGFYPSEFIVEIDLQKREVVKDLRPGSKETHPRP